MTGFRRFIGGCLPLLLALMATPAPAEVESAAVDYDRQKVTIALAEEPPQLNALKATDQVSFFVLGHVMEGLLRYDRRGKLVAGVAERWEMDDRGARFWLRKDATWSDGKPVTAHDFVFAWRQALDPATASEYAFIFYPIRHAEAINRGELDRSRLGVRAIDDRTLQVEFEQPCAYFLKLTAFGTYYPVREDFYRARADRYAADATDLLYNGPFRIESWVHGASLRMVRNERYWNRQAIHLQEIDSAYITSDTTARFNLFKDGKIAMTSLDSETMKNALELRYRIRKFTSGTVYFLEYNHRPGRATANRSLRKAIQAVFDPTELVNKVLATPGNLPSHSLFPVWLEGVNGRFQAEYPPRKIAIDLAAGRRHLDQARRELGVDRIPTLVLLVGNSPTATKQAEYVQGLLRTTLGLELKIDVQTFKQRLAKMTAGEFDMVGAGWGPDFNDIMTFGDLMASWNLNNRGRYASPEYDRLVRLAQGTTDAKVRMDAMGLAQELLIEDAVVQPEYEQGIIYVQHPRLRGVVRRVVGQDPDFTDAMVVR